MRALIAACSICLIASASAMEHYPGQYAQVSPDLREWFGKQKSPMTGHLCCSISDGVTAEEQMIGTTYFIRFDATNGLWIRVPDEVVIKEPNKNNAPVAWWQKEDDGSITIKCYAPGPKV